MLLKKIFIILCCCFFYGCEHYAKELKNVRNSPYFTKEDKTNNLAGIDLNKNNVRDDIENYINAKYAGNNEYIESLLYLSSALRNQFKATTDDREIHRQLTDEVMQQLVCLNDIEKRLGITHSNGAFLEIVAIHSNTEMRMSHSRKIDTMLSGMTFRLPNNSKCKKTFKI